MHLNSRKFNKTRAIDHKFETDALSSLYHAARDLAYFVAICNLTSDNRNDGYSYLKRKSGNTSCVEEVARSVDGVETTVKRRYVRVSN